jgi:hypothetical protein
MALSVVGVHMYPLPGAGRGVITASAHRCMSGRLFFVQPSTRRPVAGKAAKHQAWAEQRGAVTSPAEVRMAKELASSHGACKEHSDQGRTLEGTCR